LASVWHSNEGYVVLQKVWHFSSVKYITFGIFSQEELATRYAPVEFVGE